METDQFIQLALKEDIGSGDHTSQACIQPDSIQEAELLIKEDGIIAGVEAAEKIFRYLDPKINFKNYFIDGQKVHKGETGFLVKGFGQTILKTERLVLNVMQRMSGIATETAKYIEELHGLKTKILDTRKTTPLFRNFEKWAVRIGGGENHRMGLHDMILIKDNHIDYAGGVSNAIEKVKDYLRKNKLNLKVEIETRNISELEEVLKKGMIDRIMLDNFKIDELAKAIKLIHRKYETETSGSITLKNIRSYAETGVDYISVGRLTHSYKSFDLSLKAKK